MKRVTCKSGLKGTRVRLRKLYDSFAEFESFATMYGLHTRLGYDTPEKAWKANPTIEYSVDPTDYRKIAD